VKVEGLWARCGDAAEGGKAGTMALARSVFCSAAFCERTLTASFSDMVPSSSVHEPLAPLTQALLPAWFLAPTTLPARSPSFDLARVQTPDSSWPRRQTETVADTAVPRRTCEHRRARVQVVSDGDQRSGGSRENTRRRWVPCSRLKKAHNLSPGRRPKLWPKTLFSKVDHER